MCSKIKIQCENGHIYETTFGNIKAGKRCAKCVNKNIKYTIDYVKESYAAKNIILLSDTYVNAKTKLKLLCANGHIYEGRFGEINRFGCAECAGKKKHTLQYIINICFTIYNL